MGSWMIVLWTERQMMGVGLEMSELEMMALGRRWV